METKPKQTRKRKNVKSAPAPSYVDAKEAMAPEPVTVKPSKPTIDVQAIANSISALAQVNNNVAKFHKGNRSVSLNLANYDTDAQVMTTLKRHGF